MPIASTVMTENGDLGLRARKKVKTRRALEQIGIELFLSKGFEATTIDEITEVAEVSRRTFFRYFRSKDDIVFSAAGIPPRTFYNAVVNRPSHVTDIVCAREAVRDLAVRLDAHRDRTHALYTLIEDNSSLHARSMQIGDEWARELAEALLRRHGGRVDARNRLFIRLLARVTVAAFQVAMNEWRDDGGKREIQRYLDQAFATLDSSRDLNGRRR